jgi:putative transposon-encoded protein
MPLFLLQKLKVHFEKDPYPSRETKENLSEELGLTFNQVVNSAFVLPPKNFLLCHALVGVVAILLLP